MEADLAPCAKILAVDSTSERPCALQLEAESQCSTEIAQTLMGRAYTLKVEYEQNWLLEDVEERIQIIRAALAQLRDGDLGSVATSSTSQTYCTVVDDSCPATNFLYELSVALGDRYKHTGQIQDLDEQVQLLQLTMNTLLANSSSTVEIVRELGVALRSRFMHSGNLEDILKAYEFHSSLLEQHPQGDSNYPRLLCELGCSILIRDSRLASGDDLARCTEMLNMAVELLGESNPYFCIAQRMLAKALCTSHIRGGDISLVNAASTIYRNILRLQPLKHPDGWRSYNSLGSCNGMLYEKSNDLAHLDEAMRCCRCALNMLNPRNPNRALSASNLAYSLILRYNRLGVIEDLQESIRVLRPCLDFSHSWRNVILSHLAVCLRDRYQALGAADDLDESIMLLRGALSLHPKGNPRRHVQSTNLANSLYDRYLKDKRISDINEVIELRRESISLKPETHSLSSERINLAGSLIQYYEDFGDSEKLEEAVVLCELCLAGSGGKDSEQRLLAQCLSEYGKALTLRYDCYHNLDDLDRAISQFEELLSYHPVGGTYRPVSLIELAEALRRRYEALQNVSDVNKAAVLLSDALDCLPDEHPDRATCLFRLARLDLFEAVPFFGIANAAEKTKQAIAERSQNFRARLTSALDMIKHLERAKSSSEHNPHSQSALLDVYKLTIELLPHVAYFGLDLESRLHALASSDKLAGEGAARALVLSEPRMALELLEQGRAVFWSQHLRLRTAFSALPSELATKLAQTAIILERGSLPVVAEEDETLDDNLAKAAQERETVKRRRLGDEFEMLIHQTRALPGFDRFMLPETFQVLGTAATDGPVVVLLANDITCQAVVIENPDTFHQVNLPEVSLQQLQALSQAMAVAVRRGRTCLRGRVMKQSHVMPVRKCEAILAELWHRIVRKIIDALQLTKSTGRNRPRVTLCPTGVFAHLPLHAAGIYPKGKAEAVECFSDYLVPSYTPTIGALLNARQQLSSICASEAKILLAAVSQPFQWSQLPCVVDEVKHVRQAIPSQIPMDYLGDVQGPEIKPDSAPTASAVLERFPEATIVHFACHGHQDLKNPLESGFVMQDKMLTIANLMSLNLDRAFLAFLSACETAKGDKSQPDQAIHLAAAMLFAGFKSVVGTMWSMDDFDGPIVAKKVYEELFHPGAEMLDLDAIPYALDSAVRKLRVSGLAASRWAPYVHLGV